MDGIEWETEAAAHRDGMEKNGWGLGKGAVIFWATTSFI